MSYPAGARPHYMTAFKNVVSQSTATGEDYEGPVSLGDFWGAILSSESAAKEGWVSFRQVANRSHVIRAPYIDGIDSQSWVTFGTRRFNLAGPPVDPDERQAEHILLVQETGV